MLSKSGLYIGKENIHIKVVLRKIYKIGAAAVCKTAERRGGGEPAGISTHDLNDSYSGDLVNLYVAEDLLCGRRDELSGRAKAGV